MDPNTTNNQGTTSSATGSNNGSAVSYESMDAVLRSLKRSHSEIVLTFESLKKWSENYEPTLNDVEFDITDEIARIKAVGDYFNAQNAMLTGNSVNNSSHSN